MAPGGECFQKPGRIVYISFLEELTLDRSLKDLLKIKVLENVGTYKNRKTGKDAAKAILGSKFIALSAYIRKGESFKN